MIATESELVAEARDESPDDELPGLALKGYWLLHLVALRALLIGADILEVEAFPNVEIEDQDEDDSEEGPLVHRIPQDLIASLASLSSDAAAQLAEKWVKTEELQNAGWDLEETRELIGELVELSRQGLREGKPMHMQTVSVSSQSQSVSVSRTK